MCKMRQYVEGVLGSDNEEDDFAVFDISGFMDILV